MTRKDFIALADDIGLTLRRNPADAVHDAVWDDLVPLVVATLKGTNRAFDSERFIDRIRQTEKEGIR